MPRVPLLAEAELPDEYAIVDRQRDRLPDRIDAAFWNRQPTVRAFSNNLAMGESHVTANTLMWTETGLSETESECVIMRIARELNCELIWHDHVGLALEHDRLSTAEMRAIADGVYDDFDERLRALLGYTVEYVESHGAVSDETHATLTEWYDDETVVGIVMLAGFYVALCHEVRALGLTREPFVGWELEGVDDGAA